MFGYLNDHPQLERLYRNAGIVLSGNILSSFFGLGVLAVATRALTKEQHDDDALISP
jgi:O-antigen/teichoic acid export membrane protein